MKARYVDCPFCHITDEAPSANFKILFPDSKLNDECLYQTRNFYVMPDISPITPGHILAVLKNHETTCYGKNGDRLTELLKISAALSKHHEQHKGRKHVMWEHGSFASTSPAGCIEHAHVHFVPTQLKVLPILLRRVKILLSPIESVKNFLLSCDSSYILMRDIDNRWHGHSSSKIPSQALRDALNATTGAACAWETRLEKDQVEQTRSELSRTIAMYKA